MRYPNITVDNLLFMKKKYKILQRLNDNGIILTQCLSRNSYIR